MLDLLQKLESKRPFSDQEAWTLFKVAAFGEAFGWTLLITGVAIKRYITPTSNIPVLLAGRIHGVFFSLYIVAAIGLYTSLQWSRKRTIIAAMASVPPYGSLIFEQWAAYKRRQDNQKKYREITVRAISVKNGQILAYKPRHSGYYFLPGGVVKINETAEQALLLLLEDLTGGIFEITNLAFILQSRKKKIEKMELFFYVKHSSGVLKPNKKILDELEYINPMNNHSILPVFLRSEPITKIPKDKQVKFINI